MNKLTTERKYDPNGDPGDVLYDRGRNHIGPMGSAPSVKEVAQRSLHGCLERCPIELWLLKPVLDVRP